MFLFLGFNLIHALLGLCVIIGYMLLQMTVMGSGE